MYHRFTYAPNALGTGYTSASCSGAAQTKPSGSAHAPARPRQPESCHTRWVNTCFAGGSGSVNVACTPSFASAARQLVLGCRAALPGGGLPQTGQQPLGGPPLQKQPTHRSPPAPPSNRHRALGLGRGLHPQSRLPGPPRTPKAAGRPAAGAGSRTGACRGTHTSAPSSISASL